MNKILLLIALWCGSVSLPAQEKGIDFRIEPWEEVLKLAKYEKKIVFLDAFTSWCGPCKLMAKEVFSSEKVGAFFNENFINAQIDMEKGEGLELARRYDVQAYPTLLFVSSGGGLLHRASGYLDIEELIGLGENALDPEKRFSTMDQKFRDGNRNPTFLREYLYASYLAMHGNHAEVARAYLETQADWSTPENLEVIFLFADRANGKMFDYLLEHKKLFEKTFSKESVLRKIQGMILTEAFKDKTKTEEESVQAVTRLYEKAFPNVASELGANFKMNYYRQLGQYEKFADIAVEYMAANPSRDYMELNELAWTFFEAIDDRGHLRQAVKWAKKSVRLREEYFNTDTLAALYYKLGKKGPAKRAAERAIALGKASGQNVSNTEYLLREIMKLE